ncbi:MAG TPA: SufD family Fe-S cluster assembly protein, partial [Candidatus Thermoplasmatota archaeon]|nr:SufD family Fe-S cluster assembly protein [Candidatus Thermoplasmatota archaeon]
MKAAVEPRPGAQAPTDPLLEASARVRTGPGWLQELREQARQAYRDGWPHGGEPWRSTDLRPLSRMPLQAAPRPQAKPSQADLEALGFTGEGVRLVFLDGHLEPSLCRVGDLPEGVRLGGLSQAWKEPAVEDHFARHADPDDPGVLLNTLFCQDGAVVELGRGASVEEPIHVLYIATGAHADTLVAAPHTLLLAAEGAEAHVVECHAAVGTGPTVSAAVTEAVLAPGARLRHTRVQRQGLNDWHIGAVHARVGRDASFGSLTLNLGSAVGRTDVTARLTAPGADCTLDGLFLASREQQQACFTRVEHHEPHATSRQLYKGILDGAARGSFYGSVLVRPQAQRTTAQQENRNLLLSRRALVDSIPQLEIHADDVKCSHGSTIGHLQEDALFFL